MYQASPSLEGLGQLTRSQYDDHRSMEHAQKNEALASHRMGHCPMAPPSVGQGMLLERADAYNRNVYAENSLRGMSMGSHPEHGMNYGAPVGPSPQAHYHSYHPESIAHPSTSSLEAPMGTKACKSANHVYQYNGRPQDPMQRFYEQPGWMEPIGMNQGRFGLGMDTKQAARDKLEKQHYARKQGERQQTALQHQWMQANPQSYSTNGQ